MDGAVPCNTHTIEEVFRDFKGRRAAIIKALTSEAKHFHHSCDPEKDNLCLYGFPNETWEVSVPTEEVPPELPEPVLGINFARDGMENKDWLALVAFHSDAWLLSVAFYFGARFGFHKTQRKQLFNMINDLPSVFEVVDGSGKTQGKENLSTSNHSNNKSKPNSKRGSESLGIYPKMQLKDQEEDVSDKEEEEEEGEEEEEEAKEEEDEEDEDEEDQGQSLCGICKEKDVSPQFWICCDMCETWFHGKCVKISKARAAHIKQYACPSCSSNKRARF